MGCPLIGQSIQLLLDSRNRAKKPEQNGIISLKVGSLRQLKLTVVHAPSKDNRSHSLVKGVDDVEIRLKLLDKLRNTADDHIQWEIHHMATH